MRKKRINGAVFYSSGNLSRLDTSKKMIKRILVVTQRNIAEVNFFVRCPYGLSAFLCNSKFTVFAVEERSLK